VAFAAVKNGRDSAGHPETARFVLTALSARSCLDYYFVLILSHAIVPFLCCALAGLKPGLYNMQSLRGQRGRYGLR
jgi:hypothetical protein